MQRTNNRTVVEECLDMSVAGPVGWFSIILRGDIVPLGRSHPQQLDYPQTKRSMLSSQGDDDQTGANNVTLIVMQEVKGRRSTGEVERREDGGRIIRGG
jgi:hypothetical protein